MNYNQAAGKLEYTIIDPSADPTVRDANPVALVTGISVDTNDSDIALLQVEPVAPVNRELVDRRSRTDRNPTD